ncbi:YfiR family protein [Marinobacter sp. SS21]|uniref:YfiR family protein n=1 Tax=Marinobacter sp. SS21 TaxID=2979460 RepID=UPI0023303C7D|nr:YfiR family protein [Marinobacter sp. SS21]MDC0664288.1 YfiR family protein [Marinobacter sp. SS21]
MRTRIRRCLLNLWKGLLAITLCVGLSQVQASVRSEYEVKAAFLYNFTRFINWNQPPSEDTPLTVCVLGDDPFEDLLDPLVGRKAHGRVLQLRTPSEQTEMSGCHVLFVSESERFNLRAILEQATRQGMLTISDIPDFTRHGGIVGYVKQGNVIRFEINLLAAGEAGLTINSRLLELAAKVIR